MASDDRLRHAIDFTLAEVRKAGGDPFGLSLPLQTVCLVHAAQGLIDNGGLQYFFESQWPGSPPYLVFSDAYRRIGAEDAGACLDRAVAMFPFPKAHLHMEQRLAFIEAQSEQSCSEFAEMSDKLCGDESVWEKLDQYVAGQPSVFGLPKGRESP